MMDVLSVTVSKNKEIIKRLEENVNNNKGNLLELSKSLKNMQKSINEYLTLLVEESSVAGLIFQLNLA